MRILLFLSFATVALASTSLPDQGKIGRLLYDISDGHVLDLLEDGNKDAAKLAIDQDHDVMEEDMERGAIVSWKIRRFLYKLQKQMPCGWQQYGIPPLAPLKSNETEFLFKKGGFKTDDKLFQVRVDGLDDFIINKIKTSLIKHKVQFDFLFRNVTFTANKLETNTIIDVMQNLGIFVQYNGDGSVKFNLKNLRLFGSLKYKLPVLIGSAKITSLKVGVSLEKCNSNITGFIGNGSLDNVINSVTERFVEKGVVIYNTKISDLIEAKLVPMVNEQLKGENFWTLIDKILSNANEVCVPPVDSVS